MKRQRQTLWTALFFLLPNLSGFLVFMLFPIVFSFLMAFTNWSLKPSVSFEVVGLRNFMDILGVRALEHPAPYLAGVYVLACAGVVLGVLGHLWALVGAWRGVRWAGLLLVLGGVAMAAISWPLSAPQGVAIAGVVVGALGLLAVMGERGTWRFGWGAAPALLFIACLAMLALLHRPMWRAHEPNDVRFWYYLYNTLYLMLGMPFAIFGSLGLALLINEPLPQRAGRTRHVVPGICVLAGALVFFVLYGVGMPNLAVLGALCLLLCAAGLVFNVVTFRTIYYLPTFTAGVALMVLWKALYNPETGPINVSLEYLFTLLGLDIRGPRWLASVTWAKPALMLMGVWTAIGGMNMLLYLAGLSTISKDLLDAAAVDGANAWHRFRHVVWPHLAPTTFFITVISVIGGLQGGFEQARVMTLGGPAGATTTLSYYIYNIAFLEMDLGRASAISWVLFALVFAATAINWKFGKGQEVDY